MHQQSLAVFEGIPDNAPDSEAFRSLLATTKTMPNSFHSSSVVFQKSSTVLKPDLARIILTAWEISFDKQNLRSSSTLDNSSKLICAMTAHKQARMRVKRYKAEHMLREQFNLHLNCSLWLITWSWSGIEIFFKSTWRSAWIACADLLDSKGVSAIFCRVES